MYCYKLDLLEHLHPNKSECYIDNWHSFVPNTGKHKYFLFDNKYQIVTYVVSVDGYLTIENIYIEDLYMNLTETFNKLKYGLLSSHTINELKFLDIYVNMSNYVIVV